MLPVSPYPNPSLTEPPCTTHPLQPKLALCWDGASQHTAVTATRGLLLKPLSKGATLQHLDCVSPDSSVAAEPKSTQRRLPMVQRASWQAIFRFRSKFSGFRSRLTTPLLPTGYL